MVETAEGRRRRVTTVELPDTTWERLDEVARREERPKGSIIRLAIHRYLSSMDETPNTR